MAKPSFVAGVVIQLCTMLVTSTEMNRFDPNRAAGKFVNGVAVKVGSALASDSSHVLVTWWRPSPSPVRVTFGR